MVRMTAIVWSVRIGIGLKKPGFKSGCVICANSTAKPVKNRIRKHCTSLDQARRLKMNDALIRWHLFWQAVSNQEPARLDEWLARWVFADDAVRLSRKRNTE